MEKALEIKDLTKIYKNGRGVFDINLKIDKGDIFGFLGPNAAGKTTTMNMLVGFVKPNNGSIKIFGHDLEDDFENAMKNVGCIIENVNLYNYMSTYENLKLVSRYYGIIDKERIDYVLDKVGLSKYKKEKVQNFSLGMKQRLGIAIAIINKPKLAILDEPLNGLDIEGMLNIRELIMEMAKNDGTTFFISSHLIHDVELTCNRVGIILNGKIVNVDYTENILMNYESLEKYFISEVRNNEHI